MHRKGAVTIKHNKHRKERVAVNVKRIHPSAKEDRTMQLLDSKIHNKRKINQIYTLKETLQFRGVKLPQH
jgi:hypothetical protein